MLEPVTEALNPAGKLHTVGQLRADPLVGFLHHIVIVELWPQVKLNRVVTRSDRLDIPLNVVILLYLLHVVKVVDDEEGDEDCDAPKEQRSLLAVPDVCLRYRARDLNEQETFHTLALFFVVTSFVDPQVAVQVR